jgi:hypothetical protein
MDNHSELRTKYANYTGLGRWQSAADHRMTTTLEFQFSRCEVEYMEYCPNAYCWNTKQILQVEVFYSQLERQRVPLR